MVHVGGGRSADHTSAPIAQIAAHLGHADGGALALKVYVHPALHEAPEFVDGLLSGGNGDNPGGNTSPESERISRPREAANTA